MWCLPNRVFPNKIGFSITNLDIIGVIEDEEIFCKLSDDDAIRLCLLLALEESRSMLDIRPTIAEYQSSWWIDNNLYFQEFVPRAPPIKEHHGLFETYLLKLEKAHKRGKTCFMVSSIGGTADNSVRKKWLNDLVIMELNFRLFNWKLLFRQAKLKFIDEFSSMTSDLCDSLNSMFADLIEPADPDEDIGQDYLRKEELRLCLEGEEKMCCEHQKIIVEENKIRMDESKRLRLEEKNMLQLEQQKKNKRKEFMNSNHCKNLLSKLAHAKRIQLCSSSKKIQPKDTSRLLQSMDTVWLSDDIEHFLGKSRPKNSNWAMVSCYFVQILLQNGMPLFYANRERYTTTWSEVDQVFIPINETGEHWCIAQFHIMSGEVTFYDTGHTYDYNYRDWLAHGLSLDVDDLVDVALAYREKMAMVHYNSFDYVPAHHIFHTYCLSVPHPVMGFGLSFLVYQGGSYQVSVAKQVVNHAEYANSIHLVKDKLSLQVILGTDDETSSKDDASSNDEISSSEDLINYLSARDVEWQLPKNTHEEPTKPHYDPIKTEFWDSAKVKTVKGDVRLQALVDGKKIIVNEASIRRDLRLDDAEGTACLPNDIIFEALTRMGAKTTAWNEFSSTMASAIICLAKNQKFNFSKYIFDSMMKNLKKEIKFLMNMKREGKGFSGAFTPLFETMMVEAHKDMGEGGCVQTGEDSADINVKEGVTLVDETQERNDQDKFDTGVLDDDEVVAEKEVSTADPVTTAGEVVATADVEVSAATTAATTLIISKDELTLSHTLIEIKAAKPKAVTTVATTTPKAKGIVMKEPEVTTIRTTTTTVPSQSLKDKAKEKTVESEKPLKKKHQIMIDEEVARNLEAQLQAELEEEEMLARQKQEEANISLIVEWDDVQAMMDADYEQRIEEENASAELKRCLEIVPDDEDDVTVEATPLSSKSLTIIDYKIYKEERKSFFQIIRADGNSQMYLIISKMLKNINREDLEVLWSIVKSRFEKTKPADNMNNLLFQTLKTIFEHHIEDTVRKYQQGLTKVLNWKLFYSCGVYCVTMQNMVYYLLVKKINVSNEFPAGDEMFMEIDEVLFKILTKGYFEYDPLRVKTKISKRKKTSVIHDEDDDRKKSLVTGGRKGAVKRGKERGVNIKEGGFSNDGGKETMVTKRAIGSKKMEGKSVKVESE
uniref:Phospholipase-like protein n=1 Tax=Tanacetum cinerariifolium TaxID=118510 RepID=A0A699GRM7_TANCI|nr:phospholipase-like protein [Tanacetum cinerariifolium]